MPQTNRSAVIKKAISAVLNPKAPPTIRELKQHLHTLPRRAGY